MAKVLLISQKDIKVNTILDGNVDTAKFLQFVGIAQDTYLQQYLGSTLYTKMITDYASVTGKYLELLVLIKPVLVHWAMVQYLPFAPYQVANGGVFKHSPENSEVPTKEEVESLVDAERNIAQFYTERMIDFLCKNSSTISEYNSNSDSDIKPDVDAYFTGWVM